MLVGRYFPFRRTQELDLVTSFTYNLQVWLSVFAFSSVILGILSSWLGWLMLRDIPPMTFNFGTGILIAFIIAFGVLVGYSLYRIAKLFWNAVIGQIIEYDSKPTPINIIKAIKPLNTKQDLIEYKNLLQKLIDQNNELITKYYTVVKQLEEKENGAKAESYDSEFNQPKL